MPDKKLNILIVWGESLAKPSGGTVHCVGLSNGFVNGGHAVQIVTPQYKGQKIDAYDFDVKGIKLPAKSGFSFALFQFMTILSLPWWIFKYKPDVVYVRTCFFQSIMAMICRVLSKPLVGEVDSLVDVEIVLRGRSKLLAWLVRSLDKLNGFFSSGLVCVSEGLRREFIDNRWAKERTTVAIHNGALTDVMRPYDRLEMRQKFDLPIDPVLFAFAGTFTQWQGLDFLVDVVCVLKQRGVECFRVAMMGGGVLENALREWIKERKIENYFMFESSGDHQKVAKFLSACDAAIIPINDKRKIGVCSPLKFFDAISVGIPAIISEGSELDDILLDLDVPGLFDPESAESLADMLVQVINEVERFRSRREDIHQQVVKKYSWDNVADKTVKLFQALRGK